MWQEWMFQEGLPVLMGGGDWKMVHSGGLDGTGKDLRCGASLPGGDQGKQQSHSQGRRQPCNGRHHTPDGQIGRMPDGNPRHG